MNIDIDPLEQRLSAMRPKQMSASTRRKILRRLDSVAYESTLPQATHPFRDSMLALAASILVILAGTVLISGLYATRRNTTADNRGSSPLALASCNTNMDSVLYSSLNHQMHNNVVAFITGSLFSTNTSVQLL